MTICPLHAHSASSSNWHTSLKRTTYRDTSTESVSQQLVVRMLRIFCRCTRHPNFLSPYSNVYYCNRPIGPIRSVIRCAIVPFQFLLYCTRYCLPELSNSYNCNNWTYCTYFISPVSITELTTNSPRTPKHSSKGILCP